MLKTIFDCSNETSRDSLQAFIKFLNPHLEDETFMNSETKICDQLYHNNIIIEEVDVLIRIVRKNWIYLQNAVMNETTISSSELNQIREIINKCLPLIILSLKYCESNVLKQRYITTTINQIKTLLPLVLPTYELEKEIYLKLIGPSCGKNNCPIYHYFHAFHDLQFYFLLLEYVCERNDDLKKRIQFIIKDLVFFSENAYRHKSKSPFVCNCNKNIWLILQVLCEKVFCDNMFWSIFNETVENFNSEYILWLLSEVGNLQGYDLNGRQCGATSNRIKSNFSLLERCLKDVIQKAEFNSSLHFTLKAIEPLICNLWLKEAKIEVYQIIWEYFSKRLNICGSNNINLTLVELAKLIDTILWTPKDCKHDFELFLAMMTMHLTEYPIHWGKMKGRIYSQLGPNKLKDLNQSGIFNILVLFLSLTKVNFDELSKKFLSFINNLPSEKKQNQLIWTFYSAFIIRNLRENRDLEQVLPFFIKMLEEASTEHKLFYLIKHFVKDLECIINSTTNLQLHQWLLINTWIHKYMTSCYYQDLVTLLNVLLTIIEIINRELVWCEWESSFKNYVYPALKYSRNSPPISGTVAATISVLSPSLIPEAFTFFNSDAVNSKISANFLCIILENYPNSINLSTQQETLALQTWGKFCLLTRDGYDDLTKNIIKLEIIPESIKNSIVAAKDPLCGLIDCIGIDVKNHSQSPNMIKICEIIFGQAERWITQYFNQPENEAIVLRIYTCLGLAFFKIGSLLYDRHKSNCAFARLITILFLPAEIMLGKSLHQFILQSIKKTWHLFFEAVVKLNSASDPFIERILREMVVRYIPHFTTVDSPMLKCLDNEHNAEIILDKISNAFFKQSTGEAESNVFKSLKLISDIVQSTTSVVLLRKIVNKSSYGLFELIMFHNQRNMAISVVKTITSCPLFSNVRLEFEENIIQITEKHLAFNTPNYFQFLGHLAKLIPTSLRNLIPRIKQHVSNVERMRGVGYDKLLRLNMERFEASLTKSSN